MIWRIIQFVVVLGGLGLLFANEASAAERQYFLTGNDFHRMCQSAKAEAQAVVLGFSDGVEFAREVSNTKRVYCPPDGVSSVQLTDLACNFAQKNPKFRHFVAAYMIYSALSEAWPCK